MKFKGEFPYWDLSLDVRTSFAMRARCSYCKAKPDERCHNFKRRLMYYPHMVRIKQGENYYRLSLSRSK